MPRMGIIILFLQWKKSESFTLGSLSLNNFCNGIKKRTLPAKRRNLPAKRRIFFEKIGVCFAVVQKCFSWNLNAWQIKWTRQMPMKRHKNLPESKRWKGQVSTTFWGCMIFLSVSSVFWLVASEAPLGSRGFFQSVQGNQSWVPFCCGITLGLPRFCEGYVVTNGNFMTE